MFLFGKKKKEAELERRALAGDADAQYDYADLLSERKEYDRAQEFYLKAARQGHLTAIGYCFGYYFPTAYAVYEEENILSEIDIAIEMGQIALQYGDDFIAKTLPFVKRLKAVLEQYQKGALDGDDEATFAITKFLCEDPDALSVYDSVGAKDEYYECISEYLHELADNGLADANLLLMRMGL